MKIRLMTAALASALLFHAPWLAAQQASTSRPSAADIVGKLKPKPVVPNSRGVVVEDGQPVDAPASIDLDVTFEFASAKLTSDAKLTLDNLGQALKDPALSGSRFRIAGHTDAKGSDAANLALSKLRARAVANYLMAQYSIEASRLAIDGFGRQKLRDPANPTSAINRRVEVLNLGNKN